MNAFMNFWEHIASWQRMAILLGGMIFFWLVEGHYPLFTFSWKRYKHAGVNLVFLTTTVILNILLGSITILACRWVTDNHFGLLNLFNLPVWANIIIGLLFMDFFAQYAPHYLMHKVKFMWKFHMIHHSDTKVDVTTGTRHHPGEWIFRECFTIIGVYVMGLSIGMYFLYRSVSAIFTHFNHANIRVPLWLDKPISWIFVSPNMHKVHHHYKRPFTDTNYANIFSFWDRLFGTFAYTDPKQLKYGLDVLDGKTDESLGYQLKLPFNKNIKTDY
ncbi:sterol desaturase [Niastella yeongjuensis]|uniref:Sterol desaturase n=1 Tax=Niastella yeongjuensis TaxID=354355 RepID=A0A1V9EWF2_9BACT|nr:sterol desaturase family protein [Niastella yeongjuensis]OQP50466.1 sterol desaturase [Niastella yeongjuensis]SEN33265.1 Sterol desaturase/sphingolipid hydroxylase, fatty acid hydroxylase superfamily [Niastella yeongjuensis]